MNVAIAPPRLLPALARAAGGVLDAWRSITAEQVALAVLFGFAALAQVLVRALNQSGAAVVVEAVNAQLGAFSLLLAVVVADRAVDGGASRPLAYGLAVFVGAGVGMAAQMVHLHYVWDIFDSSARRVATFNPADSRYLVMRMIGLLMEWILIDGLAVYVYADRREARRMSALLHGAELARNAQAKRVLESQLQAMQARIEPKFLFNTLAQVGRLYWQAPAAAERMLDELIAYLRAAMPRMRDTSSTLAQELDLVGAYLDIVRMRLGDRLAFAIEAPDGRHVSMAPMVLLPLIDHALAHDPDPATPRSIRVDAAIAGDRLRIAIVDSAGGFDAGTSSEAIAGLRERLVALYQGGASLELRRGVGPSTEAVLEIPYETVEGVDR